MSTMSPVQVFETELLTASSVNGEVHFAFLTRMLYVPPPLVAVAVPCAYGRPGATQSGYRSESSPSFLLVNIRENLRGVPDFQEQLLPT